MNKYSEMQKDKPIIFDTCIFMVGIEKRLSDSNYSLENMRKNWMDDVLSHFENILLHEVVYNVELDSETKKVIDEHIVKNITIVDDKDLFNSDPEYMRIFNEIHDHPLMYAPFSKTKNQGEVHSLTYACYHNISLFSSKDSDACDVCSEIEELNKIEIVGFETILELHIKTIPIKIRKKPSKLCIKNFADLESDKV